MYTGTEIFNIAISILDELSDSGAIVDSQVAEYKHRAPYLLDAWQKEMATRGKLYNVHEYENTDENNVYKWTKCDLPVMKKIKDIIFVNSDSQIKPIKYKKFGNNDIYFYFKETGTVRMLYIPVPTKITDLSQVLEMDDITATSAAYYMAEHFALADQNSELAAMCRGKFKELKLESGDSDPMMPIEIEDVYGTSSIK